MSLGNLQQQEEAGGPTFLSPLRSEESLGVDLKAEDLRDFTLLDFSFALTPRGAPDASGGGMRCSGIFPGGGGLAAGATFITPQALWPTYPSAGLVCNRKLTVTITCSREGRAPVFGDCPPCRLSTRRWGGVQPPQGPRPPASGLAHHASVVHAVFGYLNLLRTKGLYCHLWDGGLRARPPNPSPILPGNLSPYRFPIPIYNSTECHRKCSDADTCTPLHCFLSSTDPPPT